MKISINVPTYKRAEILDTFKLLPCATYWVHECEVDEYREKNEGIQIGILPDEKRGNVARVRNHILNEQSSGFDAVLMIDDDMKYFGFWEARKAVKIKKEKEILAFIKRYTALAEEWGVKLWGINVNADKQVYREYTPFSLLSYVSASFSCFLKGNKLRYDERFSLCEDYDMTIQQINKYRKVLRINKYFYEKKGAEQIGGCAAYRNVEKEIEQTIQLQNKWGSRIVRFDKNARSHHSTKVRRFDINPVIKVPIRGV